MQVDGQRFEENSKRGNERAKMENNDILQDLEFIINLDEEDEAERERHLQRKKRIEEMKRKKRRAELMQRCVTAAAALLLLAVGVGIGVLIRTGLAQTENLPGTIEDGIQLADTAPEQFSEESENENFSGGVQEILQGGDFRELQNSQDSSETETEEQLEQRPLLPVFEATSTADTDGFDEEIVSEYGVLIDVADQTILAEKDYKSRMIPASMTKLLTVLVAAEVLGITDGTEEILNDTFTMTIEITDYSFENDCSIAGFLVDEEISVRDLFYGTVLPSGADAAVGLAVYVAGSHEAFVELMNEKLVAMGLSDSTHFTNCVGLYDEDHYSTVYDIAVILKEATDNSFCREVLSAHTYNTSPTEQNPEGILLSNWFLRRIEDRDTHGEVLCGKTGYVSQSRSCAASLAVDVNGREYLCVTAGSSSSWQCIDDQHMLYELYLPAEA